MGIFKRNKDERPVADTDESATDLSEATDDDTDAQSSRAASGPYDSSEVTDDSEHLKLGSLWVKGVPGMELRLELNEQEQAITGVTAVLGESAVQLQAFAAPRTEGVWVDIRNEIAKSISDSGGTAEVVSGEFGEELLTRMPQTGGDGRTVFVPARFVGVDGPRWFLRAVISGRAAIEADAAEPMRELIRTAVIDRGSDAMPPRELLPLALPEDAGAPAAEPETDDQDPSGQSLEDLNPFERGPEITEVR